MTGFTYLVRTTLNLAAAVILASCGVPSGRTPGADANRDLSPAEYPAKGFNPAGSLLVSPAIPQPGDTIRIILTGDREISKAKIRVLGPSGELVPVATRSATGIPCWRVDQFIAEAPGRYKTIVSEGIDKGLSQEFSVLSEGKIKSPENQQETPRGWDPGTEELYSAWVGALFEGCGEDASWKSLHEVTRNRQNNFLFNHLSRGEDDPAEKGSVIMQPDCADNPFFFRAYFAWKLGLPFGYHICDRGYPGKSPSTGEWVTGAFASPGSLPVPAFNTFLRKVMNGVHSGTARTSFDNNHSDYYPVALDHLSLRPGVMYADPYGHTFVIVRWIAQTRKSPGILLAVDAQPDGTIAIKRFWKGNFLFNTKEVIGEPGFKAFRPIRVASGKAVLLKNEELTEASGYIPWSGMQQHMEGSDFYHTMERLINPQPLDPEDALEELINALHEQLQVRVKSVANGDDYMRSHPGTIIPMPGSAAGIFQTGGNWENYSTPNRDLRLLIAIDAVLAFPERVARYPEDFKVKGRGAGEKMAEKLKELTEQMVSERSVTYFRSDGTPQQLTLKEILDRRAAFEMGWNPNDGPEIRWGAPENSAERSSCKRKAPAAQLEKMKTFRKWFQERLHPPT